MKHAIAAVFLVSAPTVALGDEYLVKAFGDHCVHGLHKQPAGGPFSVFVFCDDALGSNIGVIATAPGAGPGKIELDAQKTWKHWDVNKRFWQDPQWATDITSFAWSVDLKSLYVATGEVYGTGTLYRLNLVTRTVETVLPDAVMRKRIKKGYSTSTEIKAIDLAARTLKVEVSYFSPDSDRTSVDTVTVRQ
jgi:hypothetical protein